MKKQFLWVPMLALVALVGCLGSSLPQAGDTVSPRLVQDVQWQAGEEGMLMVELAATDPAGKSRRLGFQASPRTNPLAEVRFFNEAGEVLNSQHVELSERC